MVVQCEGFPSARVALAIHQHWSRPPFTVLLTSYVPVHVHRHPRLFLNRQEESYLRSLGLTGQNAMTYLAWRRRSFVSYSFLLHPLSLLLTSCLMVMLLPLLASIGISCAFLTFTFIRIRSEFGLGRYWKMSEDSKWWDKIEEEYPALSIDHMLHVVFLIFPHLLYIIYIYIPLLYLF